MLDSMPCMPSWKSWNPDTETICGSTTNGRPNSAVDWTCRSRNSRLVLRETQQAEAADEPEPRWRRLLQRRERTLADGSPHSRASIVGRHGASFAAGAVWRMWSSTILNVLRPLSARLLTILPRFAAFGGTGGSIAASTGLRFALGAFNIVGIIVGPALAAWSITQEIRNVRKAHRELDATRMQRQDELARYTGRTRQLERQLAAAKPPADVVAS